MTSHAVKEIIRDNVVCVEIELQDPKDLILAMARNTVSDIAWDVKCHLYLRKFSTPKHGEWEEKHMTIVSPIAMGDTVYQGRECLFQTDAFPHSWKSPETMPIERADKTFKVVGIETEKRELDGNIVLTPPVWFWNYKLEPK